MAKKSWVDKAAETTSPLQALAATIRRLRATGLADWSDAVNAAAQTPLARRVPKSKQWGLTGTKSSKVCTYGEGP
jgi:hypothetical protein